MKKGLFILSSDNMNLSLINLYVKFIEKDEYIIDCYAIYNNPFALQAFKKSGYPVRYIDKLDGQIISQYSFIVCGRNCFDFDAAKMFIEYEGTIFTDDTPYYEGNDVYGDVIFTNGICNSKNIPKVLNVEQHIVGCLKAESEINYCQDKQLWDHYKGYSTKVLFIESGHYPFGANGRKKLAVSFAKTVKLHPECLFVVKPRYLIGESDLSRHSNEDYLLHYVKKCFDHHFPDNLVWLDTYIPISELIPGSDIVIHTYSSGHAEAAISKKRIINICGIPSDETADFRKNRFSLITKMIDNAGNNVNVDILAESIYNAHRVDNSYLESIHSYRHVPSEAIYKIIDVHKQQKDIRIQRLIGYFLKKIHKLENRFDEYDYFSSCLEKDLHFLSENCDNIDVSITFIEKKIIEYVYRYIDENWEKVCNSEFDRAYALRVMFDRKDYKKANQILEYSYNKNTEDAAWFYFNSMITYEEGNTKSAKQFAEKYLEFVDGHKHEHTDAENNEYIQKMHEILAWKGNE